MTTLMSAAFAAVVVARLRSLPGAVAAALAMGIVTDVIQKYLPPNSSFTAAIIPSIPFAFIAISLIIQSIWSKSIDESGGVGGPLDKAIRPANVDTEDSTAATGPQPFWERGLTLIPLVAVGVLPVIFSGSAFWLGLTALGMCYGITFLTFTVVTGEGGMLWLSQIIFAGVGALGAPQFAASWHIPILLAIVVAALVAAVGGAIIGLLTIRLGDLYVALATLTFGLLMEQLVFTRNRFLQGGLGVTVNRPTFATGDLAFSYLAFGVFLLLALLTLNMRRSTSGLARVERHPGQDPGRHSGRVHGSDRRRLPRHGHPHRAAVVVRDVRGSGLARGRRGHGRAVADRRSTGWHGICSAARRAADLRAGTLG
jgi:branched-chain amino acid transport system permease protein